MQAHLGSQALQTPATEVRGEGAGLAAVEEEEVGVSAPAELLRSVSTELVVLLDCRRLPFRHSAILLAGSGRALQDGTANRCLHVTPIIE